MSNVPSRTGEAPTAGDDSTNALRLFCERAYAEFHDPALIAPDPLQRVLAYDDHADREVMGLLASSLALGRVDGILGAIADVERRLARLSATPSRALRDASLVELREASAGFGYRFFDEDQLGGFLIAMKRVLGRYGSVERCLAAGLEGADSGGCARAPCEHTGGRLIAGLSHLVDELRRSADGALDRSILLSRPEKGSACKRLFLFARWFVRRDAIDPGGWSVLSPAELLVPVDTHVLKLARALGLTRRAQASLAVSVEVTAALRRVDPADPVRFDFALTRPGINPLLDERQWLGTLTQTA